MVQIGDKDLKLMQVNEGFFWRSGNRGASRCPLFFKGSSLQINYAKLTVSLLFHLIQGPIFIFFNKNKRKKNCTCKSSFICYFSIFVLEINYVDEL